MRRHEALAGASAAALAGPGLCRLLPLTNQDPGVAPALRRHDVFRRRMLIAVHGASPGSFCRCHGAGLQHRGGGGGGWASGGSQQQTRASRLLHRHASTAAGCQTACRRARLAGEAAGERRLRETTLARAVCCLTAPRSDLLTNNERALAAHRRTRRAPSPSGSARVCRYWGALDSFLVASEGRKRRQNTICHASHVRAQRACRLPRAAAPERKRDTSRPQSRQQARTPQHGGKEC